jgi:hypothetical protein
MNRNPDAFRDPRSQPGRCVVNHLERHAVPMSAKARRILTALQAPGQEKMLRVTPGRGAVVKHAA